MLSTYEAGYTGAGQTVAIIDTGIDLNHFDLNANISASSIDIVVNSFVTVDDVDGHGTAVAGVIGAEKNGFGMHGIAYEATLLAIRADALGSCFPVLNCGFIDPDLADAVGLRRGPGCRRHQHEPGRRRSEGRSAHYRHEKRHRRRRHHRHRLGQRIHRQPLLPPPSTPRTPPTAA